MNRLNRSSAAAAKVALALTVLVFSFFGSAFSTGALDAMPAAPVVEAEGAGVDRPDAEGVPTCRSRPCVSMRTTGNSANLVSSAVGSLVLTVLYSVSTAGEEAVVRLHSYCRHKVK